MNIIQSDCGVVLKDLLTEMNHFILLKWHYSNSDKNTPLLAELSMILDHWDAYVISIDDARLFTGEEEP